MATPRDISPRSSTAAGAAAFFASFDDDDAARHDGALGAIGERSFVIRHAHMPPEARMREADAGRRR